MPSGIDTIDILNDALYLTNGSLYTDGTAIQAVAGTPEDTKGTIMGSDWYVSWNDNNTSFKLKAVRQTEVNLAGLDHAVIAPIALATFQCESPGLIGKGGTAYMRDFTWVTTRPLDFDEVLARLDDFSPVPPYMRFNNAYTSGSLPAMIAKEQLFLGRAQLWAYDSSLDELLGFMRPLWGQDYNLGNSASTVKLYFTRAVFCSGDKSSGSVPAFLIDLPARHDQLAYALTDADENTEAMTMIRSYQAPQGPEAE
jgi:hypothetical protein